jgi:hypothetical protein
MPAGTWEPVTAKVSRAGTAAIRSPGRHMAEDAGQVEHVGDEQVAGRLLGDRDAGAGKENAAPSGPVRLISGMMRPASGSSPLTALRSCNGAVRLLL